MTACLLIPARRHSTRLPDKMLLDICGKPAFKWVEDACIATGLATWVVTDDAEIEALAVRAIRVDQQTANGTERCALALDSLPPEYARIGIIAGDETCVTPANILALAQAASAGGVWTAICQIPKHAVTTVKAQSEMLAYFSRSERLPYAALGMYVYPRPLLHAYYWQWPMSGRERSDGVELLRPFEQGYPIQTCIVQHPGYGLNTAEDAEAIRAWRGTLSAGV